MSVTPISQTRCCVCGRPYAHGARFIGVQDLATKQTMYACSACFVVAANIARVKRVRRLRHNIITAIAYVAAALVLVVVVVPPAIVIVAVCVLISVMVVCLFLVGTVVAGIFG